MKKQLLLATMLVLVSMPASAATKTYQVTGPVVALTADAITVQKGTEKWEIARGSATVPASVQVGSKVTVQYSMTASTVTDKGASTSK